MTSKIPDLNVTYVEEDISCWYSLTHGYLVPDTYDGFDDILDEITNGDVTTPFVVLPLDFELAASYFVESKAERRVVVLGLGSQKSEMNNFVARLEEDVEEDSDLGLETRKVVLGEESHLGGVNDLWEDLAVINWPALLRLPEFKGAKERMEREKRVKEEDETRKKSKEEKQ